MRVFQSSLAAACLLGIAAAVAAQEPLGVLPVERQFATAPAVRDDSRRFVPQINLTPSVAPDRPENPLPPITLGSGNFSPLVPGNAGGFNRINRKAVFPGIGATGWTPPDPNLAVGPNHIVQVVNSSVAFFDKGTGTKTFQQTMDGASGFFGSVGAGTFVFDPKCMYDPISQRFIVLALDLVTTTGAEDSFFVIAVSDDNNPTGNWYKYRINCKLTIGDSTYWMDYPSLATNKDGIAICGNMFGLTGSGGWAGVEFVTMKKAPMLTGQATTVTILRDASGASAQLSRANDALAPQIYGNCFTSTSGMRIYALQNLATAPAVVFQNITIPNFTPPNKDANSTGGMLLDSIDSRAFNSAYRAGKIYTTHNVSVSGSNAQLQARWYQVKTNGWPAVGTPALEMVGDVKGGTGVDHWMPAIGVNNLGDVALIFSRASTSITADVMVTSRRASDPPGAMGTPIRLESSTTSYGGPSRWGDYFDVAVDPSDNLKFWGVGMISGASGAWQTVIHSWNVSSLINIANEFNALTAAMYDGSSSTGTVTDVHAVDGSFFTIVSRYFSGLGSVCAIQTTYDIGDGPFNPALIGLRLKATTSKKQTGMWWLYNFTTGQYDHIGSWSQGTTMGTPLSVSTSNNPGRYVSPSGEVRVVVRTTSRPTQSAGYTLSVDLATLLVTNANPPPP